MSNYTIWAVALLLLSGAIALLVGIRSLYGWRRATVALPPTGQQDYSAGTFAVVRLNDFSDLSFEALVRQLGLAPRWPTQPLTITALGMVAVSSAIALLTIWHTPVVDGPLTDWSKLGVCGCGVLVAAGLWGIQHWADPKPQALQHWLPRFLVVPMVVSVAWVLFKLLFWLVLVVLLWLAVEPNPMMSRLCLTLYGVVWIVAIAVGIVRDWRHQWRPVGGYSCKICDGTIEEVGDRARLFSLLGYGTAIDERVAYRAWHCGHCYPQYLQEDAEGLFLITAKEKRSHGSTTM